MAEVFLCRTGQLTAMSRREMKKAGIVVVEVEDPASCQFIRSGEAIPAGDLLWAACDALNTTTSWTSSDVAHRDRFARNVFGLIEAARSGRRAPVAD